MNRWVAIDYREFWDVPRIFFATDAGRLVLFDCAFNEVLEDYPEVYRIYAMPSLSPDALAGSWKDIHRKATRFLGAVPISRVTFDPTKRKQIDASVLDELLAAAIPSK